MTRLGSGTKQASVLVTGTGSINDVYQTLNNSSDIPAVRTSMCGASVGRALEAEVDFDMDPIRIGLLVSDRELSTLSVVSRDGSFVEQECAAAHSSESDHVCRAWSRLSSATPLSADTYADLLMLLMETAPAGRVAVSHTGSLQPFARARARKPDRRSAAHPRAYRGTKESLPKPRQLALGPLALLRNDLQAVQTVLNQHAQEDRQAARETLLGLGYTQQKIEWSLACLKEARWFSSAFQRCILPSLRGAVWPIVRSAASLFQRLGLEQDSEQRGAVARWFAINGAAQAEHSLAWLQWLANCPIEHRTVFAKILARTHGASITTPPEAFVFGDWSCQNPNKRLDFALRARLAGMSDSYFRGAFRILDSRPWHSFSTDQASANDPAYDVELVSLLLQRVGGGALLQAEIWAASGILPGLSVALRQLSLLVGVAPASPERKAARVLLGFWTGLRWSEIPSLGLWADAVFDATAGLYGWMKCFEDGAELELAERILDGCLVELKTKEQIAAKLSLLTTLVSQLVRAKATVEVQIALAKVVRRLDPTQLQLWTEAPTRSHEELGKACRRANDAWRIRRGLWTFAEILPELLIRAFTRHPKQLLRTSLAIGDARMAQRRAAMRGLPTLNPNTIDDLVALRRAGRTNPVSRRLRQHLEGRVSLSPTSLARHRRVVSEHSDLVALDTVRLSVERALAGGVALQDLSPARAHAMRLEGWAEDNRRALRRLLAVPPSAVGDYIFEHPRAKQWLARNLALASRLDLWRKGVSLVGEVDGQMVMLAVCQDPLETLRMGTHVGSCLGLGGGFMYSAAAVALDLNKRVVYAKTASGRVVGRQQLSWTDQGGLVCHTPYPLHTSDELTALFAEYDTRFAAALNVTLDDADYTVSCVLSSACYDDGPWRELHRRSLDHRNDLGVREVRGGPIRLADPGAAEVCAGQVGVLQAGACQIGVHILGVS